MRLENFAKNLQFFFNEKSVRELNFVQQNNISLKNHKLQTATEKKKKRTDIINQY